MKIKYIEVLDIWVEGLNKFFYDNNEFLNLDNLDYELNICSMEYKEIFHKKYMKSDWQGNHCYRAITLSKKKKIFVFLNDGETFPSLLWVIVHELTHAQISQNLFLKNILRKNFNTLLRTNNIKTVQEYEQKLKDDIFHDSILEEQIANQMATTFIGENYDRSWWRNQLLNKVS